MNTFFDASPDPHLNPPIKNAPQHGQVLTQARVFAGAYVSEAIAARLHRKFRL